MWLMIRLAACCTCVPRSCCSDHHPRVPSKVDRCWLQERLWGRTFLSSTRTTLSTSLPTIVCAVRTACNPGLLMFLLTTSFAARIVKRRPIQIPKGKHTSETTASTENHAVSNGVFTWSKKPIGSRSLPRPLAPRCPSEGKPVQKGPEMRTDSNLGAPRIIYPKSGVYQQTGALYVHMTADPRVLCLCAAAERQTKKPCGCTCLQRPAWRPPS